MTGEQRDLVRSRFSFFVLWVLPPTAMVAAVNGNLARRHVAAVWTVSLLVMSAGCLLNTLRCGRLHCALTAPFFLLMAVWTVLHGWDAPVFRGAGWGLIGAVTLVGGLVLTYVPERIWGKYFRR